VPLYEYRCLKCGHQFEKIQSFSAPEVKECPICKGEVERLISAPAIQFKGSGWYATDYAGKGGSKTTQKSDDSDKAAAPSAENKAASSSDGSSASAPAPSSAKSE
jgi:putative FmdB family regulatory protein